MLTREQLEGLKAHFEERALIVEKIKAKHQKKVVVDVYKERLKKFKGI